MADLTIIAAAGDNPNYGLPGVSSRSRQQQKSLDLGTVSLLQIFDDRQDIRDSAWASRAWYVMPTYESKMRYTLTLRKDTPRRLPSKKKTNLHRSRSILPLRQHVLPGVRGPETFPPCIRVMGWSGWFASLWCDSKSQSLGFQRRSDSFGVHRKESILRD